MSKNLFITKQYQRYNGYIFWSFLLIVILAGLYFRLKGLGKWPLAEDEYYLVTSVENILKFGLPHWESGGYYVRGLFNQYLTACLFLTGLKAEFASRIIPVVFNLITLLPLFILSKKVSNKSLGILVIILFCFSVWEIEMARFARMYSAFQMIFMFYMLSLYNTLVENDVTSRKWMYILSSFSVIVFEGGIFLTILNFVEIFWNGRIKFKSLIISVLIFIAAYSFLTYNFRFLGAIYPFPTDVHLPFRQKSGMFKLPFLLLIPLLKSQFWTAVFALLSLYTLYVIYKIFKSAEIHSYKKASLAVLSVLSVFNLFGLILISIILSLLSNKYSFNDLKNKVFRISITPVVLNLFFWIIFCFSTNSLEYFSGEFNSGSLIKETFVVLFRYPDLWWWLKTFLETIPYFTVTAFLLLFVNYFIIVFTKHSDQSNIKFLYFILIIVLTIVTALSISIETRYTFFIFPLILLLVMISLNNISAFVGKSVFLQRFSFSVLIILYISISEDFNINHIFNIDSKEVNFRMNYSVNLAEHYYRRWDVKSPADVINKELQKNDIIIANQLEVEFYLQKLDYIFIDFRNPRILQQSVLGGRRERFTNAKLIYKLADLERLLEREDVRIWFIEYKTDPRFKRELEEISFYKRFGKYFYYTSIDSLISVYKITNEKKIKL